MLRYDLQSLQDVYIPPAIDFADGLISQGGGFAELGICKFLDCTARIDGRNGFCRSL